MLTKKLLLPAAALIASAGIFSTSQAYAFSDNDAAVLVGVAVGGLTAYAIKHAHDRDRYIESYHERREYREPPRRYCPPRRVEHYVIHNPPQYREWDRDGGYGRAAYHDNGRHRGGYEYEYEYKRRSF